MSRRTAIVALVAAGAARAGTTYDAVVTAEFNLISWNSAATIDLYMEQSTGTVPIPLRLLQLDFSDTDPAIVLDGFAFDTSNLPIGDFLQAVFVDLNGTGTASSTFTGLMNQPGLQYILPPAGRPLHIGTLSITLPGVGSYPFDMADADNPDSNEGAQIQFGFGLVPEDPVTTWSAAGGEIGIGTPDGGPYYIMDPGYPPEPATLLLMGAGGLIVLRRRGGRRK